MRNSHAHKISKIFSQVNSLKNYVCNTPTFHLMYLISIIVPPFGQVRGPLLIEDFALAIKTRTKKTTQVLSRFASRSPVFID